MSNYFANLAARICSPANALRPRVASRFETSQEQGPELMQESTSSPSGNALVGLDDVEISNIRGAEPVARRTNAEAGLVEASTKAAAVHEAKEVNGQPPTKTPTTGSVVSAKARMATPPPNDFGPVLVKNESAAALEPDGQNADDDRSGARISPAQGAWPGSGGDLHSDIQNSHVQARGNRMPPSIKVTIGRVEVRAVFPSSQPPKPERRAAAPRMSLGEYLRRGHGDRS